MGWKKKSLGSGGSTLILGRTVLFGSVSSGRCIKFHVSRFFFLHLSFYQFLPHLAFFEMALSKVPVHKARARTCPEYHQGCNAAVQTSWRQWWYSAEQLNLECNVVLYTALLQTLASSEIKRSVNGLNWLFQTDILLLNSVHFWPDDKVSSLNLRTGAA